MTAAPHNTFCYGGKRWNEVEMKEVINMVRDIAPLRRLTVSGQGCCSFDESQANRIFGTDRSMLWQSVTVKTH